jgi:hypothetical protein
MQCCGSETKVSDPDLARNLYFGSGLDPDLAKSFRSFWFQIRIRNTGKMYWYGSLFLNCTVHICALFFVASCYAVWVF